MFKKIRTILEWLIPFDFGINNNQEELQVPRYRGEDVWIATVCYLPLVSAVVMVLRRNNSDFVLNHSKQALILSILFLLVFMILSSWLRILAEAAILSLIIISVYKAFNGRKIYIPLITEVSQFIEI